MGKKKAGLTGSSEPEDGDNGARTAGDTEAEQSPEIKAAAEAVERAEAELEKARQLYREVRREATERLAQVRQKRVGELVDDALKLVRKHPGPSLLIAAMAGFWLGRLFRR